MQILSHRGYWKTKEEQNQRIAFKRSFELGFGTETDIRWINGRFEIRHDLEEPNAILLEDVLELARPSNLTLALNIKADGMAAHLAAYMEAAKYENYFVFDMSVPDMIQQLKAGHAVFTRLSEIERQPVLLERCAGVWLDAFNSDWYSEHDIISLVSIGKKVCVVSPELHRRPHEGVWNMLRELDSKTLSSVLLCTDLPEEAQHFFANKK